MIVKQPRGDGFAYGSEKLFDLKIIDKNNNSFIMTVGGNQDLYWIPQNHKETKTFLIDKDDEFLFEVFKKLFKEIQKEESDGLKYPKTMDGNKFTFISEDYPEDEANRLEIIKEKDKFIINFIKSENLGVFGGFRRGCVICFCNSGSRVPKIEQRFMLAFNDLAYYNDNVQIEL